MRCPMCEGDLEPIELRTVGGDACAVKRCLQCSGFWFEKPLHETLDAQSVSAYDTPQPNYSLQSVSLMCPVDQTVMQQSDHVANEAGLKNWHCSDCGGSFYPKGQLALATYRRSLAKAEKMPTASAGLSPRGQVMAAFLMVTLGTIAVIASLDKVTGTGLVLQAAAVTEPLPNTGPELLTLVLIALAYLAGTILAVLGRKLPIILMGWGVIAICLLGFSVIIFGA